MTLILDYGNVLTWPQAADAVAAMAARVGTAVETFAAAYWEHRRRYDAGDDTADDYWRRVLRSLGMPASADEPDGERALLDWLTARDGDSWMRYREEVWDFARSERAGGVRTAMLSNMGVELARHIRRDRLFEDWFDVVVISGEVRCIKPDPRIYRLCLERLEVEAPQVLFVDDRPENVAAAAALGMRTVHFVGGDAVAALRRALESRR
jgi:putative hydrolase of the HAD superfamily